MRQFATATDSGASSENSKGEYLLQIISLSVPIGCWFERSSNATLLIKLGSARKSSAVVKDVNESGGKSSVKKEKMDLNPPKVLFLELESELFFHLLRLCRRL